MEIGVILGFEAHIARRQTLCSFNVTIHLKIDATLQLGTLSGKLLRIERYILISGSARSHRHKVGHPTRATQRTAARTDTANSPCLLACANLFHFDANLKHIGKHLDELAEIDALIGNIIEYGLIAVTLILHVADFHVQMQIFGNLA